jgi:Neuraminidase (sialidase)
MSRFTQRPEPTVVTQDHERPDHSDIDVRIRIYSDDCSDSYTFVLSHYPMQPNSKPHFTDHNSADSPDAAMNLARRFIRDSSGERTIWVPNPDPFSEHYN